MNICHLLHDLFDKGVSSGVQISVESFISYMHHAHEHTSLPLTSTYSTYSIQHIIHRSYLSLPGSSLITSLRRASHMACSWERWRPPRWRPPGAAADSTKAEAKGSSSRGGRGFRVNRGNRMSSRLGISKACNHFGRMNLQKLGTGRKRAGHSVAGVRLIFFSVIKAPVESGCWCKWN